MSRERDQLVGQVEAAILERITSLHAVMEWQIAKLEPLEAISLVGMLMDDTLDRFSADERTLMLAAMVAELRGDAP